MFTQTQWTNTTNLVSYNAYHELQNLDFAFAAVKFD